MSRARPVARRRGPLAVLSVCLLLGATAARAQVVTESSLKAAFIHSFVRFTEWPKDVLPPSIPLQACVLGDPAFADVLRNYVNGHPIDGHPIVVSRMTANGLLRSCHLLYVSGVTSKQAAEVAAGLDGVPVLTLSDVDQFARVSGTAQLYVENGRIRFRVNLANARRARLQLSSRLLSLATLVTEAPNASNR
jgi:YfiR/HmsC-like